MELWETEHILDMKKYQHVLLIDDLQSVFSEYQKIKLNIKKWKDY